MRDEQDRGENERLSHRGKLAADPRRGKRRGAA
jgi:hypothetical protein